MADAFISSSSVEEMVHRSISAMNDEQRRELRAFVDEAMAQASPSEALVSYNEAASTIPRPFSR